MADYRLSNEAKNDLIRIHQYGVKRFGEVQADSYFNNFFDCFDMIAKRPFSYESVNYIKEGYRRCVCGVDSIYFRVKDEVVEILAIIGRQDVNGILK
ncbi:type II toxin-antitoxin system RelE/ParE family toxin [Marivirga harenae]|uniref:type II toxin-antitoxin system RelE/ParE family toxin n=1 Tax=Marivirga harenae TaxID=2010992 RepID=UPI0026E04524|nr:type II toxin-antitoxin system RelE/ParE family toxin [Marivirga harenae]WKV11837.1 type II toxin-antitoxin system RelE/ParE family toxin [Marivirga harenae]